VLRTPVRLTAGVMRIPSAGVTPVYVNNEVRHRRRVYG